MSSSQNLRSYSWCLITFQIITKKQKSITVSVNFNDEQKPNNCNLSLPEMHFIYRIQRYVFLRSTIGERSPKLGVPVVTYHVISQAWRIEIFWVDGRCAKSAPFWILNKSYAHASIYFYQERGLCARNYFQLKTFPRLSRAQWHFSNGNLSFHNSNFERTSLIPDYS